MSFSFLPPLFKEETFTPYPLKGVYNNLTTKKTLQYKIPLGPNQQKMAF